MAGPRLHPPDAPRVARRALVSVVLSCRGDLERSDKRELATARAADLLPFLESAGAAEALEPFDREILEAPVGELAQRTLDDALWSAEIAGVFTWALGLVDTLPELERTQGVVFAKALGFAHAERSARVIASAALRERPELESFARATLLRRSALHGQGRKSSQRLSAQLLGLQLEGLGLAPATDRERAATAASLPDAATVKKQGCLGLHVVRSLAVEWLLGAHAKFWRVDGGESDEHDGE